MIKLRASYLDRTYNVEIEPIPGAERKFECRVVSTGEPTVLRIEVLSRVGSRWTLRVNGRVEDLIIGSNQGQYVVQRKNHLHRLRISNPKDSFHRKGEDEHGGHTEVFSPMAGRVVSISKGPGDSVEARETVAAIEAMKMLNQIKAPRAGKIKRRLIETGDLVSPGQVLFELE